MSSPIGVFSTFCSTHPTSIRVSENIEAEGGIVAFQAVADNGDPIIQSTGPDPDKRGMDIHVGDNKGNLVFRLKRGALDNGFVAEKPDGSGHLFRIHKKHLSTTPEMEVTFTGQNGSDSLLYHFDESIITHNNNPVARTTRRGGMQRNFSAKDEFTMNVDAGVDVALVAALAICADQHICDRRNEGYTSP